MTHPTGEHTNRCKHLIIRVIREIRGFSFSLVGLPRGRPPRLVLDAVPQTLPATIRSFAG